MAVNYASPTSGRAGAVGMAARRGNRELAHAQPGGGEQCRDLHRLRTGRPGPDPDSRHTTCASTLAAGELIEVLTDARAEPLPVQLVYPHWRNLSRRVQAFAGWLETLLSDSLDPRAVSKTGGARASRR